MTTAAQPEENAPAAGLRRVAIYQVFRSLLAWAALTFALTWMTRDVLYLANVEFSYQALANFFQRIGYEWLGKVVARMATSDFEQAQLLLFVIAVAYGLAQMVAAMIDRRVVLGTLQRAGHNRASNKIAAMLLARPLSFFLKAPSQAEIASHFLQGREMVFSPLKLGLWLFPVLGFLGTIIGISAAIEQLPEAMKERGTQISGVVNELHFAFDTTFIGLIAAIVLMLITAAAASIWERNEAMYRGE